jgi:hypothetical protein
VHLSEDELHPDINAPEPIATAPASTERRETGSVDRLPASALPSLFFMLSSGSSLQGFTPRLRATPSVRISQLAKPRRLVPVAACRSSYEHLKG